MSKNQTSRREWIFENGLGVAAAAFSGRLASFATIDGRASEPMQAEAKTAATGDEKDRVRRMKWWHEARFGMFIHRSEERRVGKECSSRCSTDPEKKNEHIRRKTQRG